MWTSSPQIDLSSHDVGVQPVLSVLSSSCDAAEEPAFSSTVDGCVHRSNIHGCVDTPVIPLLGRGDRDLSGIKIDVLVARNILHLYFSCRHLDGQAHLARHFDTNLKIAMRWVRAGDFQSGIGSGSRQMKTDMPGAIRIGGGARDMNHLLVGPNHLQARRSRV